MTDDKEMISGQVVVSFIEYVKKRWGDEGVTKMGKEVGFSINSISTERDYPMAYTHQFMEYLERAYGDNAVINLGKFTVSNIGSKRYFALLLPPDKLLEKLAESVPKVNNAVRVKYVLDGKSAVVTISANNMTRLTRIYWKGMLLGILDMTKRDGKITLVDDSQEESIVYKMEW